MAVSAIADLSLSKTHWVVTETVCEILLTPFWVIPMELHHANKQPMGLFVYIEHVEHQELVSSQTLIFLPTLPPILPKISSVLEETHHFKTTTFTHHFKTTTTVVSLTILF